MYVPPVEGECCPECVLSGDINQDGSINVSDVVISVNIVLGMSPYNELADLNNDNLINVLDITLGVCSILNTTNNDCLASCNWDMNNDNEYNVVDIILIINIIIN